MLTDGFAKLNRVVLGEIIPHTNSRYLLCKILQREGERNLISRDHTWSWCPCPPCQCSDRTWRWARGRLCALAKQTEPRPWPRLSTPLGLRSALQKAPGPQLVRACRRALITEHNCPNITLTISYSGFSCINLVNNHLKLTRSGAGEHFKLFRHPLLLFLHRQASFHLFSSSRCGFIQRTTPFHQSCAKLGGGAGRRAGRAMAAGCCSNGCLTFLAVASIVISLIVTGIHFWMEEKSYVFSGEEIALITTRALERTRGEHILWEKGKDCQGDLLCPAQASRPTPPCSW